MNLKLVLAGATIAACTSAVAASTDDDQYPWVMGVGAGSCGKLLTAERENSKLGMQIYVTWTQGYLSGVNFVKDKQAKNLRTDPDTILAYLLKHCHDKPLDEIYTVVGALIVDLSVKN